MSDVRYSEGHEWIRVEGEVGVVGITDYAQDQLGDVVYVELPEVGQRVEKAAEAAVVESVKAASEVYAPATGEVVAVNDALNDDPSAVNSDPEGAGWFIKIKLDDVAELDRLMDAEAYGKYLESLD
jgi:glycine cleavage system H protein